MKPVTRSWAAFSLCIACIAFATIASSASRDVVRGFLDSDNVPDIATIVEVEPESGPCWISQLTVKLSSEQTVHSGEKVFSDSCTSGPAVEIASHALVVINNNEAAGVRQKATFIFDQIQNSILLVKVEKDVFGPETDPVGQHRSVVWNVQAGVITTLDAATGRKVVDRVKPVTRTLEETDASVDYDPDIFAEEIFGTAQ